MLKATGSTFIGCASDFADASLVLFGAPFDGTVSFRPGTRFAPAQIRLESVGLETYSPYFDADLTDFALCDLGDLELPFGTTARALQLIQEQARQIFQNKKKLIMIGGEHLVSLPAVTEAKRLYEDLVVLHFDAHTDLRTEYLGEPLSHATVMRRIWEVVGDGRIWQFGIRSGTREEFHWAKAGHTFLQLHDFTGLEAAIAGIGRRPVYLTIDLDVLDPSVLPGTGTPEAGGVSFLDLMTALQAVSNLNIIGGDLVELAPHYDPSGVSTAVASKVLRELIFTVSL
ncbi:agmatinase [Capillibacterium thermochitinicola]|uniref:Agmatinase n=1 Tax=Capillibacterium thermochitinicola TaxID=2699427 RepID=A0A8J6I112_9FIRM|nr:agmatinase [Capillibacterium thermochitinicola]MBA2132714.1 agmatinase [Capillibacterium thermochitinicola]